MDLIVRFVHQNLKIQFSNVRSLQHNTGKSLVFLECQTEEQALSAVDINDGRHEITIENVKYAVGVYMEDGATTVRVHDVSPQSENSVIQQELEKYGDVIWMKEEKYTEPAILKGIKNGVRAVRIKIHTAIPSYINIRGEVTLITYKNQQQTCRHCNKPVHWGRKCVEVSYMEMQLQAGIGGNISDRLRASGVDYAGALAAGSQTKQQASTSIGSGKGDKSMTTNFTNLTKIFRSNQTTVKSSVTPVVQTHYEMDTQTNDTNITNSTSEHKVPSSTTTSKNSSTQQTTSSQMKLGEHGSIEAGETAVESEFRKPTIPIANSFSVLFSDDDMNDKDSSRSRSCSPSQQKKRGRSSRSSK